MSVMGFKTSLTRREANLDDITVLQNCEYERKVSILHRFGIQIVHYIDLGLVLQPMVPGVQAMEHNSRIRRRLHGKVG